MELRFFIPRNNNDDIIGNYDVRYDRQITAKSPFCRQNRQTVGRDSVNKPQTPKRDNHRTSKPCQKDVNRKIFLYDTIKCSGESASFMESDR